MANIQKRFKAAESSVAFALLHAMKTDFFDTKKGQYSMNAFTVFCETVAESVDADALALDMAGVRL